MASSYNKFGVRKKVIDGITFRSSLEANCYKLLRDSGLEFEYEPKKELLLSGFKMRNTKLYCPDKKKKLILYEKKILDISYLPDFVVKHGCLSFYIDSKGMETPEYKIKKKLFLKKLEETKNNFFFEPHNLSQMSLVIEIIKGTIEMYHGKV